MAPLVMSVHVDQADQTATRHAMCSWTAVAMVYAMAGTIHACVSLGLLAISVRSTSEYAKWTQTAVEVQPRARWLERVCARQARRVSHAVSVCVVLQERRVRTRATCGVTARMRVVYVMRGTIRARAFRGSLASGARSTCVSVQETQTAAREADVQRTPSVCVGECHRV